MILPLFFLGSMIYYQEGPREETYYNPGRPSNEIESSKSVSSYKIDLLGNTEIKGPINKKSVKTVLKNNSPRFQRCFTKESKNSLKVGFEINQSGSVSEKKQGEEKLEKCVSQIIQNINFPKPSGTEKVKVNQTFSNPHNEEEGYQGLQNHICKNIVLNFLVYAHIKIESPIDEKHYKASLLSLDKIICDYSNHLPMRAKDFFILKLEKNINPNEHCAYLPLARTWQIYDSNYASMWVWKIAPRSFLVEKLYKEPVFYPCSIKK